MDPLEIIHSFVQLLDTGTANTPMLIDGEGIHATVSFDGEHGRVPFAQVTSLWDDTAKTPVYSCDSSVCEDAFTLVYNLQSIYLDRLDREPALNGRPICFHISSLKTDRLVNTIRALMNSDCRRMGSLYPSVLCECADSPTDDPYLQLTNILYIIDPSPF